LATSIKMHCHPRPQINTNNEAVRQNKLDSAKLQCLACAAVSVSNFQFDSWLGRNQVT